MVFVSPELDGKAIRVTCLSQQLFGFLRVILQQGFILFRISRVVAFILGSEEAVMLSAGSGVNSVNYSIQVKGIGQGLANLLVVQRRHRTVEHNIGSGESIAGPDIAVGILAQRVHRSGQRLHADIHVTCLKSQGSGSGVGNDTEYQVLELRLFAPVILVALKHNAITGNPFNKLVWAGTCAVQIPDKGLRSRTFNCLLAQNAVSGIAHKIFHGREGLKCDDVQSIVVDNLTLLQIVHIVEGALQRQLIAALVHVQNVLGRHFFAVVEVNVISQMEPNRCVVHVLPGFCQDTFIFHGCVITPQQALTMNL